MPPEQAISSTVPVPIPPLKIGKFKASKLIVEQSWAILMKDKEIMLFPIVSSVVSLIAVIIMVAVYYYVVLNGDMSVLENQKNGDMSALSYIVLFIYYLVMFFIVNFFQSAVYIIVHARFNGRDMNFNDGMNGAVQNINKIIAWSLISATVGVILKIISDRSKLVGKIVISLLGAAWGILTYFSLPSLVIGQTTIANSFKESAAMIRKTWGEIIIVNLGVGLFFALLLFVGFFACIVTIFLTQDSFMALIVMLLFVIYIIILSVVSASLSAIFKLALYEYARTGIVPQGFSPELIQNAIKRK